MASEVARRGSDVRVTQRVQDAVPAFYRPVAVSDRPTVRSAVRLRKVVVNGGQPGQSDAHSFDAGGNRTDQGAPGEMVESHRSVP